MLKPALPAVTVPGDNSLSVMARHPHLHSSTQSYALWQFGWPAQSGRAIQTGCFNPQYFTWVIASADGKPLYIIHGSAPKVFATDTLMFAWLGGLALERELDDLTAREVRKANIKGVA